EWDSFYLDALAPAKGNGTGQGIVLKIDDVPGQLWTGFTIDAFVLLAPGVEVRLAHDELAQGTGQGQPGEIGASQGSLARDRDWDERRVGAFQDIMRGG